MGTERKQAQQKPPPGMVFIEDYEEDDGTVTPGIATRLGVTPSSYRKWRMAGKGPLTFFLGKRVAARVEAVDAWIAEQEQAALRPNPETRPPEPRLDRHPVTAAA
jgi:hypothetical protein